MSHENFSVVDKAYVFTLHDFMNDKLIQRSKQIKKSRQSNLNSNYSVLLCWCLWKYKLYVYQPKILSLLQFVSESTILHYFVSEHEKNFKLQTDSTV